MADRWRDDDRRGSGPGYRDRDDDRFGRYGAGGSGERDFARPFDRGQPGLGGGGRRTEDRWPGREDRGPGGYGQQDWRGQDRDRDNWGRRSADSNRDRYGDRGSDRDWMDRAGDEVASWFGDDEAERRRRQDERRDDDPYRRRFGYGPDYGQSSRGRFRDNW